MNVLRCSASFHGCGFGVGLTGPGGIEGARYALSGALRTTSNAQGVGENELPTPQADTSVHNVDYDLPVTLKRNGGNTYWLLGSERARPRGVVSSPCAERREGGGSGPRSRDREGGGSPVGTVKIVRWGTPGENFAWRPSRAQNPAQIRSKGGGNMRAAGAKNVDYQSKSNQTY